MSQPNPSDRASLSTVADSPQVPLFSAPHELVTIYVGPEKKPFIIHKEVASYSPVLKAAFNSGFVEGQTQTYNLENADPGEFQLLVQWLYTKNIQFCVTDAEITSFQVAADGSMEYDMDTYTKLAQHSMQLVYLWVTADYLQVPRLQNLIVDQLDNLREDWDCIAYHALYYLYANVPPDAPLRLLIVEHCTRSFSHILFRMNSHLFPRQMLINIIVAQKIREEHDRTQLPQPDPFTDRAEFIALFHVPEDL